MSLRTCTVSNQDAEGIRHAVEVPAESLFEAAALGLQVLQTAEFLEVPSSPSIVLQIHVHDSVSVTHEVTLGKLRNWLCGATRGPAERVLKGKLLRGLPWLKSARLG